MRTASLSLALVLAVCGAAFAHPPDHSIHQHEHEHHHTHDHHAHDEPSTLIQIVSGLVGGNGEEWAAWLTPSSEPREKQQIWLEAIGATVFISILPCILLMVIPLGYKSRAEERPRLNVLLSFAVGGLLGDVFLHLLPHSFVPHSHGEEHDHHDHGHDHDHQAGLNVGLWVLGGILVFFIIEKFVRHISGSSHGHSHSHSSPPPSSERSSREGDSSVRRRKKVKKATEIVDDVEEADKPDLHLRVVGYLNLVADFSHNFTDGLALGASFMVSQRLGMLSTLAVLIHEIPHEIGDFAILLQSGFSRSKAMLLQLVTALGALTGCVCALMWESDRESSPPWILPFTSGGFIYVAMVTVIPELLADTKSVWQSAKEVIAFLIGVGLMLAVAFCEE